MQALVYPHALETLLPRFIRRDPAVEREFDRLARPYLLALAERVGKFLPPDLHKDVVQQAMELLLGRAGHGFNPSRGTAKAFLRLVARRAARDVGAAHVSAGRRTRPLASAAAKEEVPLTAAPSVGTGRQSDAETLTFPSPENVVEIRHDVDAVLAAAPADVGRALRHIYLLDQPATRVAAEMNISRYALDRKIEAFVEKIAA